MNFRYTLALFLILSFVLPLSATPQAAGDWSSVQALRQGAKTQVELKNGSLRTGRVTSVTDSAITLKIGKQVVEFKRDEIFHVYRPGSKHIAKSTAKAAGIGALAGAAVGAALGDDGPLAISRAGCAILGAMLFAVPGAIVGLIKGATNERDLIVIY